MVVSDSVSACLAIGGFWRPGSADNVCPRRSVLPNVDAGSADNRKDWRPMPVYHRQQGARAPAVCACLASVDAAKRVEKRAGCRLKLTRRGWRPCCCPPMDRASPFQSTPRLANCKKLARLLLDAACADEIQRRVHLAESARSYMEIKRRSHQARMA